MHRIQEDLLKLSGDHEVTEMKLADLARLLGVEHLQQIKHHRNQLIKKNLLKPAENSKKIHKETLGESTLVRIPVLGSASAGPASIYVDGQVTGYLRVSASLLPRTVSHKALYALKVIGRSMNLAKIGPQKLSAENGDYVVADGGGYEPKDSDYVVSIIEGKANIKKLVIDKENDQIVLVSESTDDFPPIVIRNDDSTDYLAQSEIVNVVKIPKL